MSLPQVALLVLWRSTIPAEREDTKLGKGTAGSPTSRVEVRQSPRWPEAYYFDLIDYKHVAAASQNWHLFEPLLGYGKGGKDKKLAWLDFVNEKRKVVAHVSSGVTLSLEDLETLQGHERWLQGQLSVGVSAESNADSVGA